MGFNSAFKKLNKFWKELIKSM